MVYTVNMKLFHSPWLLIISQLSTILGVGLVQWLLMGGVTFVLPLLALVFGLYLHMLWLHKRLALPQMPADIKTYWGIALIWSFMLVVIFTITQPLSEVIRIAKVLPILWLGVGLMDWVLMVCTQQLVGQQWGEQSNDNEHD